MVDVPGASLLDASVLRSFTVRTLLNGSVQETASQTGTLALDVVGLIGGSGKSLVGFVATKPYNQVSISVSAMLLTADLPDAARVYEPCLALAPLP